MKDRGAWKFFEILICVICRLPAKDEISAAKVNDICTRNEDAQSVANIGYDRKFFQCGIDLLHWYKYIHLSFNF